MALTQVDQGLLGQYAQYTGFKNRLINGQMQINQRAITTLNPSNGEYSLDRWKCFQSTSGKYTVQSSTTAPGGFTNSALITSSAATTLGATDYNLFQQSIEVANFADMQWGTASASPVTVSFWVRSSLTGTFGGSLRTNSSTYNYPFSYTISAANTWEYKTITIPGPTSGSWNGTGLNDGAVQVAWSLGVGSTYSGTANAWTGTSNIFQPTGSTSVVSTNGATLYITGVQLEKGSTATSFDFRPYGTELALCQRYYRGGMVLTTTGTGTVSYLRASSLMPVTMRSTPTYVLTDNAGNVNKVSGDSTNNIPGSVGGGANYVYIQSEAYTIGTNVFMNGNVTASAEL